MRGLHSNLAACFGSPLSSLQYFLEERRLESHKLSPKCNRCETICQIIMEIYESLVAKTAQIDYQCNLFFTYEMLGLASLLLFTTSCVFCSEIEKAGLTFQERHWLINFHHSQREQVKPPASNMVYMNYSLDLEKLAASILSSCKMLEINETNMENYSWNLAFSLNGTPSVQEFASAWAHQKQHFENSPNGTCSYCGEYKKIVWATSREMGCARRNCGNSTVLLCIYFPGGNWQTDSPYLRGSSCSGCGINVTCTQNQCDLNPHSRNRLGAMFWGFKPSLAVTARPLSKVHKMEPARTTSDQPTFLAKHNPVHEV
nr:Allergen V5 Tpx 1 [Hymenolepis microstoma]